MTLELKRAQRSKAYLKLGMSAPSGGGKTVGALLIAYGLMKEKYPHETDAFRWGKIAIVDTENGSGELYVGSEIGGTKIGVYNAITLTEPFTVDKYTRSIELCHEAGMEVCILDSTTHLWTGTGGLLEKQSNISKKTGNSYTAWRDVTPEYKKFIDTMLQTPIHIIATARSKQEYVIDKNDSGKSNVRKVGLEPEQRKGFEFEFTTFFEIDADHMAFGAKDRTSLFDGKFFTITPKVGAELMRWLENATDEEAEVVATAHPAEPEESIDSLKQGIMETLSALGGSKNQALRTLVKEFAPNGNPNSIKDVTKLLELKDKLELFAVASEKNEQ